MEDRYTKLAIQPFEYSYENKLDPYQHTAIKYITRFRDKNGLEDIDKAIDTLNQLKKAEYPDYKEKEKTIQNIDEFGIERRLLDVLIKQIPRSRYDRIVTTGRGGMWAAANLAYALNISIIRCEPINEVEKYSSARTLFVDSICDTGETVKNLNIDTAVLVTKDVGKITYYAYLDGTDQYVNFPIGQMYDEQK